MKNAKELYMYVLGAIIVIGFFICLYFLIEVEMPKANENMLYMVIGALEAKFSDVVSYFYGSSKGSADKTEHLTKQNDGKAGQQ